MENNVLPFRHVTIEIEGQTVTAAFSKGVIAAVDRFAKKIEAEATKPGEPRQTLVIRVMPSEALRELLENDRAFELEVAPF